MDEESFNKYLMLIPVPTLRLTLSSGDRIVVRDEDGPFTNGITLVLGGRKGAGRFAAGPRFVSIPNIVLVEPVEEPVPRRGRGRR